MPTKYANKQLQEDWLNDDKTMIITDSEYEIKNKMMSAPHMMRILYDGIIDKYMMCDGYNNVHEQMIQAAFDNYYYPFKKGGFWNSGLQKVRYCPDSVFISYVPKQSDQAKDEEKMYEIMANEGYRAVYIYPFGYIFSEELKKNKKFSELDLYKQLGQCKEVKSLYDYLPLVEL